MSWHCQYLNISRITLLSRSHAISKLNKMAHTHPREYANNIGREIIPTAVMIKYIPLDWKPDHVLRFISQRKLPSPSDLKCLYDDYRVFRGMAFATFASTGESQRVIQNLHNYRVSGRTLHVQFRRKCSKAVAAEKVDSQPKHHSHTDVPDKADPIPQAKASGATRPTREQTPPCDSYHLLMSYQTNSVEKEKLRRFLAQTGDYQEAVNEFARNRARETQAGLHGWIAEDGTILEERPPTPGEEMQVAEMEGRFGIDGGKISSGSVIVRCEGECDVTGVTERRLIMGANHVPLEKGHNAFAE